MPFDLRWLQDRLQRGFWLVGERLELLVKGRAKFTSKSKAGGAQSPKALPNKVCVSTPCCVARREYRAMQKIRQGPSARHSFTEGARRHCKPRLLIRASSRALAPLTLKLTMIRRPTSQVPYPWDWTKFWMGFSIHGALCYGRLGLSTRNTSPNVARSHEKQKSL